jgi:hypothetical protein
MDEFPLIYHDFVSRFLMFLKAVDTANEFDWQFQAGLNYTLHSKELKN